MNKPGFFRRWARLKSGGDSGAVPDPVRARDYLRAGDGAPNTRAPAAPVPEPLAGFEPLAETAQHPPVAPAPPPAQGRAPTLDDAALLGPDSDFSAFVSQGVDKAVQRLAMKKLFADPHFNVMDGLDVYIEDFTKADPIPAVMAASLQHARSVFARFLDDDQNQGEPGHEPKEQRPDPDPPSQGNA
jgi:Protein of unknown function (DUF3306)